MKRGVLISALLALLPTVSLPQECGSLPLLTLAEGGNRQVWVRGSQSESTGNAEAASGIYSEPQSTMNVGYHSLRNLEDNLFSTYSVSYGYAQNASAFSQLGAGAAIVDSRWCGRFHLNYRLDSSNGWEGGLELGRRWGIPQSRAHLFGALLWSDIVYRDGYSNVSDEDRRVAGKFGVTAPLLRTNWFVSALAQATHSDFRLSRVRRWTTGYGLHLFVPMSGIRSPRQPPRSIPASASSQTPPSPTLTAPPDISVTDIAFIDANGDRRLAAGEEATVRFRILNTGKGPTGAITIEGKGGPQILGLRRVVGQISAGSEVTASLPLSGGELLQDGTAQVEILVRDANGFEASPIVVRVETRAFRGPEFIVDGVAVEDIAGRSVIRAGQVINLQLRLKNAGEGPAERVAARISAGPNVFLVGGPSNQVLEYQLGDLSAGEARDIRFQAFTNNQAGQSFPVAVSIVERTGRYGKQIPDLGLSQEVSSRTIAELDVQGAPLAVSSPENEMLPVRANSLLSGIPKARRRQPDAVAVLIGNRRYRKAPEVLYAVNDVAVTRRYLEESLGFSAGNIIEITDASGSELNALFGTRGNPTGRLRDIVKPGVSEVFVFFSGHGAPDPRTEGAYLMPVDADADRLELTAYSLETLYENLAALRAKHVTAVLEACFSGAAGNGERLVTAASPIGLRVRDPSAQFGQGSVTILTAAQGQELANWYPLMRHGLFTYFFLSGLQGKADDNGDGAVSVGEMRRWLTDPTRGVPSESRRLFGVNRQQTPQVFGSSDVILRQ